MSFTANSKYVFGSWLNYQNVKDLFKGQSYQKSYDMMAVQINNWFSNSMFPFSSLTAEQPGGFQVRQSVYHTFPAFLLAKN